ncbi:hypothetical protein ABMA27_006640 [Loxostege sticticalis]|uniref:Peptidase M14 domain-containing protein n=1 Tax=Loxostege sticticalis TaxID=481309 RepID=A0ABR3IJU8_LOXSC
MCAAESRQDVPRMWARRPAIKSNPEPSGKSRHRFPRSDADATRSSILACELTPCELWADIHRCGLTNEDLNRRWCKPSPVLHPSIYHTKGLIEYLVRVWKKPPLVYCDYHGHSRKKNVFFYGCAAAESWCSNDRLVQDEPVKYLMLPALMHRISPAFALGSCSFRVERERESTARVTVWRHLGVTRSYTMEASFCGFDRGPFKGFHLNTQHLQSVGSDFCEALNGLNDTATNVDIQLTKDLNGEIAVDSEPGSGSDSVLKTDSDEDFD